MESMMKSTESSLNPETNLEKNNPFHEDENKKRRLLIDNNSSPITTNEELSQRLNTGNFMIDTAMGEIECMISHFFKKKESFGQSFSIHSAYELLRKTSLEIIKISSKVINQEEKNAILLDKIIQQEEKTSSLMQQIINIQSGNVNENNPKTYLQAAQENLSNRNAISEGRALPLPQLPKEIKHAPSEKIIIIKAEEKEKPPQWRCKKHSYGP